MKRLRYQSPDAGTLGIADLVLTNDAIMAEVARLHAEGKRCAAVVFLDRAGGFQDGYAGDQITIQERLPFAPLQELLAAYDPAESVCLVVIRDGTVSASAVGQRGKRPAKAKSQ